NRSAESRERSWRARDLDGTAPAKRRRFAGERGANRCARQQTNMGRPLSTQDFRPLGSAKRYHQSYFSEPSTHAFRRSKQAEETLAEARTACGANTMFYNLHWTTAEREFKPAIELNRNYEITYELYSYLLLSMGRADEGIKMTQRGLEVAPLSTLIADDVAYAYYLARRYDEAIRTCQKSLELDPNHFGGPLNLGVVYEAKGMHDEAIKQFEKSIAIGGRTSGVLAVLAHAYATSGRQAEAQKMLAELNEMSKQAYVSSYDLAILYVGLGDKDRALERLNKAYEERAGFIIYLNVEPVFDPLRSDPRFAELVRKMKFQS